MMDAVAQATNGEQTHNQKPSESHIGTDDDREYWVTTVIVLTSPISETSNPIVHGRKIDFMSQPL